MAFVYNTTFVIARGQESRLLSWLRSEAVPRLFAACSGAVSPRLQTVVEAGGEKPGPDHGVSIALQAEFDSEVAAHRWNDEVLLPVLGDFHAKFGPHALFFTTLLEILPL